jgi:hypothetical protein
MLGTRVARLWRILRGMRACRFVASLALALVSFVAPSAQGRGSIAGRIITPDGVAAADIEVFVARRGEPRSPLARTRSAWDGRYEITGLPPGSFLVGAFADAGLLTLYPGVEETGSAALVTVFDGVPAEGIDIWLLPAPRRFAVSGRVTNTAGAGLRNVDIEYGTPGGAAAGIWSVGHPDGLFTIETTPGGTLVLLARAQTADGLLMGIASTEVTLGAIEDIRIVAATPGRIEGRVAWPEGAPPAGVRPRVSVVQTLLTPSALYPDESVVAAADGSFRVDNVVGQFRIEVRGLPPGWTVTRTIRNGRVLGAEPLTVRPGETAGGVVVEVASR